MHHSVVSRATMCMNLTETSSCIFGRSSRPGDFCEDGGLRRRTVSAGYAKRTPQLVM
jgi:hypothetical protein